MHLVWTHILIIVTGEITFYHYNFCFNSGKWHFAFIWQIKSVNSWWDTYGSSSKVYASLAIFGAKYNCQQVSYKAFLKKRNKLTDFESQRRSAFFFNCISDNGKVMILLTDLLHTSVKIAACCWVLINKYFNFNNAKM